MGDLAMLTAPPCIETRDCVILGNIAWLMASGYTLSVSREFVVDPDGDGGFAVGLLDEAGLTPATRAA
jgi:hypothetical protein